MENGFNLLSQVFRQFIFRIAKGEGAGQSFKLQRLLTVFFFAQLEVIW